MWSCDQNALVQLRGAVPVVPIQVRAVVAALLDGLPDVWLELAKPPVFRYGARGFAQHGTETLHVLM